MVLYNVIALTINEKTKDISFEENVFTSTRYLSSHPMLF